MRIEVMSMGVDFNGTYKKIAFTGHRPNKLGGYDRNNPIRKMIRSKLREVCYHFVLNCGTEDFMQGMALGIDQDAGDVIISIMNQMVEESDGTSYVSLHAAIPFPGHDGVWPEKSRLYYQDMLDTISDYAHMGSEIHYVHNTKPRNMGEAAKWLDERNHFMVDWCDLLIGVWDGTPGGTKNCIDYTKKVGKPILLLRLIEE